MFRPGHSSLPNGTQKTLARERRRMRLQDASRQGGTDSFRRERPCVAQHASAPASVASCLAQSEQLLRNGLRTAAGRSSSPALSDFNTIRNKKHQFSWTSRQKDRICLGGVEPCRRGALRLSPAGEVGAMILFGAGFRRGRERQAHYSEWQGPTGLPGRGDCRLCGCETRRCSH